MTAWTWAWLDLARCAWLCALCTLAYARVLARRLLLRRPHELGWPVDVEMLCAGFRTCLLHGNLATFRLMLGALAVPWLHPGLAIERLQPCGCAPVFWLRLRGDAPPPQLAAGPRAWREAGAQQQPHVVLIYVHGGAFVAGHPLMSAAVIGRWMRRLAAHGVRAQCACLAYPLAPEQPFPAPVEAVAAALAWLGRCFAASSTQLLLMGDSAGGNLALAGLAALRALQQQEQQAQQAQQGFQEQPVAADATSNGSDESASSVGSSPAQAAVAAAAAASPAGEAAGDASDGSDAVAAANRQLFAGLRARLAAAEPDHGRPGSLGTICRPVAAVLISPATDLAAATTSLASGSQQHDYLPPRLVTSGMSRYLPPLGPGLTAADEAHLACSPWASPARLPSFDGLLEPPGAWLVLSGGAEMMRPSIEAFARRLAASCGKEAVTFVEAPGLPHSWAILPTPSLQQQQEVVLRFIARVAAAGGT